MTACQFLTEHIDYFSLSQMAKAVNMKRQTFIDKLNDEEKWHEIEPKLKEVFLPMRNKLNKM